MYDDPSVESQKLERSEPSSLNASLTTSHETTAGSAAYRPTSVAMWSCMAVRRAGAASPCTHDGVWLCQTSVWPCTCWPFCRANATTWSAPARFHPPSDGSVASHFIAFSAVTWLNSAAASERYAASLASGPVAAAYPMNFPRAAAWTRSGSSAEAGGAAASSAAATRAAAAAAAAIRAWWRMARGPFETGVRRPRPPGEREACRWKRSQYRTRGATPSTPNQLTGL